MLDYHAAVIGRITGPALPSVCVHELPLDKEKTKKLNLDKNHWQANFQIERSKIGGWTAEICFSCVSFVE